MVPGGAEHSQRVRLALLHDAPRAGADRCYYRRLDNPESMEMNVNHDFRHYVLAGLLLATAGCSDAFEPILTPLPAVREAVLVDFESGDLVDPAAFDVLVSGAVRTDQTNSWDFLFVIDDALGPVLLPRGGLLDQESTSGIQSDERAFEDIERAPEDGYSTEEAIPIAPGTVVTMVSRQSPNFSVRCRLYGKLEVLSIEGAPARATFRFVVNPNCERRRVREAE